jgi:large subunit ribosomal protein L12
MKGGKNMEYIYGALLLHAAGKEVTEANVTLVLKAAGVNPDAGRVKALIASLDGVDIKEAISTASFAAPAAAAPAAAAPAKAGGKGKKKEVEEEEEEEEEQVTEEEAMAGLGALFG